GGGTRPSQIRFIHRGLPLDPYVTSYLRMRGRAAMAHTVKHVAAMSGVSVRTLHFYDQIGLLKPAYRGAGGYRFYQEPQLLMLQQILFYRELGFELKQIKRIVGGRGFRKSAALKSHRNVLQQQLARTHRLIETVDKTL